MPKPEISGKHTTSYMENGEMVSSRWDAEYSGGKYSKDPPLPFVEKIMHVLNQRHKSKGVGLYVGCGNGRNYTPLSRHLNLYGLDISKVVARELLKKAPESEDRLKCVNFLEFEPAKLFDYIISIQTFQHGTADIVREYFKHTRDILKQGGLLFLRVNSVSTDIYNKHRVVEETETGGITIRYTDGPKSGIDVHFYSRRDLDEMCEGFEYITPPYEKSTLRNYPKSGSWVQWEAVLWKTK